MRTRAISNAPLRPRKGFQAWRKVSPFDRYKIMRKAGELMRQRVDDIAKTMTLEQGEPVGKAKLELIRRRCDRRVRRNGLRAYGWIIPPRFEGVYQLAMKEPVGPVAAFTPWNFR